MSAPSASRWSAFSVCPPSATRSSVSPTVSKRNASARAVAERRPAAVGIVAEVGRAARAQTASATWRARYAGSPRSANQAASVGRGQPGDPGPCVGGHGVDASAASASSADVRTTLPTMAGRPAEECRATSSACRPAGWTSSRRRRPSAVDERQSVAASPRVPGRRRRRRRVAPPDDEPADRRVSTNDAGPRLVGADLAFELGRRPRRVEPAVLAPERPGQRRAVVGLRRRRRSRRGATVRASRASSVRGRDRAASASSSGAVSVPSSGHALLGDDRPGVEAGVHPHQRHAGLAVAGEDRGRDRASRRGGAAAATGGGSARRAAGRAARAGTICP